MKFGNVEIVRCPRCDSEQFRVVGRADFCPCCALLVRCAKGHEYVVEEPPAKPTCRRCGAATTTRSFALRITCPDDHEYTIWPIFVSGPGAAGYSSDRDFCTECGQSTVAEYLDDYERGARVPAATVRDHIRGKKKKGRWD